VHHFPSTTYESTDFRKNSPLGHFLDVFELLEALFDLWALDGDKSHLTSFYYNTAG